MQDRRLARIERQAEVAAQVRELSIGRGMHAIEVEPGLADCRDVRICRQVFDRRPIGLRSGRRVMRVDADGGLDPVEFGRELHRRGRRTGVPARHEQPLDASQCGLGDDLSPVGLEGLGPQVGVTVDQPHRCREPAAQPAAGVVGSDSRRGKSGSAIVTRPASAAWAPQRSSSSSAGPPLPSAPYGYS